MRPGSDRDLDLAQRVLDWLAGDWPGRPLISVPDLYTFGPGPVRDKENRQQDHRHPRRPRLARARSGQARVNGTMRREVWRLVSGAGR